MIHASVLHVSTFGPSLLPVLSDKNEPVTVARMPSGADGEPIMNPVQPAVLVSPGPRPSSIAYDTPHEPDPRLTQSMTCEPQEFHVMEIYPWISTSSVR